MNSKIIVDTHLIDEILLNVMLQCCGNEDETEINNQCLSAFEDACDYLTERGYLQTLNGRIYKLKEKCRKAEIKKLESQIITMGLNGMAYTHKWNEIFGKLYKLKSRKADWEKHNFTSGEQCKVCGGYHKGKQNRKVGCGKLIYKNDTIKCGEWSGGDQHFCKKCYKLKYGKKECRKADIPRIQDHPAWKDYKEEESRKAGEL